MKKPASNFEDYLELIIATAAKKQALLARDMSYLVTSNLWESLTTLINELLSKLKDEHVFAEDDPLYPHRRAEIKGSIVAIQTLLSMILEFAKAHQEEAPTPGWAPTNDEDDAMPELDAPLPPRGRG